MPFAREHRVDLGFQPFAHQRQAHLMRMATRFLVLVWHRRAGKTVFAVMELVLAALACTKRNGRYGYIAPYLRQARDAAWTYLKMFARLVPHTTIHEADLYVEFANGARVRIGGADNPDSWRGVYWDGVVLDEVADMRPQIWGEVIRPALTDRQGWALFIGTPKGVNMFSEVYNQGLRGMQGDPKWAGWASDLRRADETGVLPDAEIEQARREMSPPLFAQEMDCDFAAAVEDVLLSLNDVLAAQRRTCIERDYRHAAKVLGVDCARYGGDRNVIAPRQGMAAFLPKILGGMDTMAMAGAVAQYIDEWQPDAIFVDVGGIGAGVYDRLQQLGYDVTPVDFGGRPISPKYENKRAEIWDEMADWVRGIGCLPDIVELRQDLPGPRYTYKNKRGCMQLESKDAMRARGVVSPDVGDALACTFAYPVSPKSDRRKLVENASDYRPFARLEQSHDEDED